MQSPTPVIAARMPPRHKGARHAHVAIAPDAASAHLEAPGEITESGVLYGMTTSKGLWRSW